MSVKPSDRLSSRRTVPRGTVPGHTAEIKCRFECGTCSAACPSGAIRETAAGVSIDRSLCSRCRICIKLCPAGLIGDDEVA